MDLIRKTFATHIVRAGEGEATKTVRFVASSARPDSYNDVVEQDWVFDDFLANPVIPWGHDYHMLPVGRAVSVAVGTASDAGFTDPVLLAEVEFDEDDEFAAKVASKYRRGFLNAVSVGFVPGEWVPRANLSKEDPRYAVSGYLYRKPRLKEISAVTVPANPDATAIRGMAQPAAKGFDLRAEILRALRTDAEVRSEIEAMLLLRESGVRSDDLAGVRSIFGLGV